VGEEEENSGKGRRSIFPSPPGHSSVFFPRIFFLLPTSFPLYACYAGYFRYKMKNIEAETNTTQNECFEGVLYFGWPNQPSSGTMRILHWEYAAYSHYQKYEKLIDSVNYR